MLAPWIDDAKVFNIKDIQAYSKEHNVKMLSEYNADFWAGYKANYQYFDRLFMKKYSSWFPFDQEYSEGIASVQQDFTYDVYAHLLANDKRYSELWRVNVIPDNEAYSLTNNVDYQEIYEGTDGRDTTYNKGAQSDSESGYTQYGERTDTEDLSATKGEQTDTEDLSATKGEHETETKNSTSPYNVNTFEAVDKTEVDDKEHTDTEDNSRTYGERTDTEDNSRTYGAHRDDTKLTRSEGAREDSTTETGSKDYTLHKVGNMGVQTVMDMLEKQVGLWTMFNFYDFVFQEIAAALLRGC